MIPELAMNPLAPRVIALFESDTDDGINFKQFTKTLAAFHESNGELFKMKCS
jgi:hypothetical protein